MYDPLRRAAVRQMRNRCAVDVRLGRPSVEDAQWHSRLGQPTRYPCSCVLGSKQRLHGQRTLQLSLNMTHLSGALVREALHRVTQERDVVDVLYLSLLLYHLV